MLICINKNSVEYQTLKERSGIPESILEPICRGYLTKYGRFPYLDEFNSSNSKSNLEHELDVKNESASINKILEYTNKDNIEDANIIINDVHRDLEVKLIPINDKAFVEIKHRPKCNNLNVEPILLDSSVNNFAAFGEILMKLSELYGINFNYISEDELASEEWQKLMPEGAFVNGFIFNGEIYLNADRMDSSTPIHELMHFLIGGLRFHEPNLYQQLVNSVEHWENYSELAKQFKGRSRNDINEEIFVTEVSKLLAGQDSQLLNTTDKVKYEIKYNVSRLLDSILMGLNSVNTISPQRLFNMSMTEIAEELGSDIFVNKFHGTFNSPGSELHRRLNNVKQELMRNNELIEQCE